MEHLEYLIRSLTYKRSGLELELKKEPDSEYLKGEINGLTISISMIYGLVLDSCDCDCDCDSD
jgi:hypothetical protein